MSQTTTTAAVQSACPECDASVSFSRAPLNGQVTRCSDCRAELEVTSVSPLTLELAPEVEEDWGE
ncbi:MAG: lysine biosynthesis protein LysW [Phycisphaerales bacterium]|nr:lysine biosynthesis protein LysW [Phycisphaerales bacterium]